MSNQDFPFGPVPSPTKKDLLERILILEHDVDLILEIVKKMHRQMYDIQMIYGRYFQNLKEDEND